MRPVVLALEDLHWADPTTLDVLRGIAERGALAPLLVLATMRPEFRAPWSVRSHHSVISLAPLDRTQVHDMVAELSARHALPSNLVEDVAARTGGVPLFVEEVTRLLLERGDQGGIQGIPPTLQQSLMARLDRLGPAREVAQIGSVIGRGFSYGLLRDIAGMEDAPLQAALEKLADADILLVQGLPPDSDYRFKHALIQDAAYENLLKSRRQLLHRHVAEIFTRSSRFNSGNCAGSYCSPLHESGPHRRRDRMVGQGRRSGAAPFRLSGGDRASRQGDRDGGQGERRCAARGGRQCCCNAEPEVEVADQLRASVNLG
jgi:predicted ATPase